MKKITVWHYKHNNGYLYSHTEEGWAYGFSPLPQSREEQENWKGKEWSKIFTHMRENPANAGVAV